MAEGTFVNSGIRLVVEGAAEFEQRLKDASQALSQNAAEQRKLDEQYGKRSQNTEYLTQKQEKLNEQLELQKKRTQALRDTLAEYQKRQDAQPDKIAKLNLAITRSEALENRYGRQIKETGIALGMNETALEDTAQAVDSAGNAVKRAEGDIKQANDAVKDGTSKLHAYGEAAVKAGDKMSKIGGKMTKGITLPIVGAFTKAAKEAIDFEDAFTGVVKTVDASREELDRLQREVVDLSGSGLVTQNKEEISAVAANAGQLGIATKNIMGFSQAMLQMADATNLSSDSASIGLAQFANITGMAQDKFSNLGSAIVALGNNSASQEDAIVNLGMRLAAAGTTAKMSVADIMGVSAAFSSVGVEAEAGGTSISKLWLDMDTSVAKGANAAQKFGKIAGVTGKQFQDMWKQDAAGAFTAFIEGLQKVEREGGNVALTLEKVGIKDQRMRDAMLRAVSAGGLLSESISRSNTEFEKNTALAEEAAKKNSSYAARMKILSNRFDNAAMSMGEQLMPILEDGMETVTGWVDAFGKLDPEMKKNIVHWGMLAAAIGPALKVVGSVSKGVGALMKGFGALGTLMASPAGPVLLGVAAFGALAFAIASNETPLERIRKRMDALKFEVDPERVKGIREGIEQGIEAADREYTIRAGIRVEMEALGDSVDAAFGDGKVSGKEKKSLKKQLNDMVKASVDEAQKDLQTSVDGYVKTLEGLKDAKGEDLFTDSEKEAFLEGVTSKTNDLIGKLESYQSEYDALLDTISKQREPVTSAQMAEMDALLAQIGLVRAEIKLANDEAVQAARMQYELTVSGKGNEQTAAVGAGYVAGQAKREKEQVTEKLDTQLALIDQAGGDTEKAAEAVKVSTAELTKVNENVNQRVNELFAGAVANAQELTAEVEKAAAAYDLLKQVEEAYSEGYLDTDKAAQVLTPEVIASLGFEGMSIESVMASGDDVGVFVDMLYEQISEQIASVAELLAAENPLTAMLKTMMEKLSAEDIELDPSAAEGVLEALLKVLDFAGKGEEFGLDLMDAFTREVQDPANLSKVEEAGEAMADSAEKGLATLSGRGGKISDDTTDGFVNQAAANNRRFEQAGIGNAAAYLKGFNSKAGLDINSPSKKTAKSAFWAVKGYVGEIDHLLPSVRRSGEKMGIAASEALDRVIARPRLPEGMGFDFGLAGNPERLYEAMYGRGQRQSGQGVTNNTVDQSVPVYIDQMIVRKESDINAIGAELTALRRRTQRGYGS